MHGRTIAPFNEPSTIYWWAGNNQEGCHFDISTQNIIITKLAEKLQASFLSSTIQFMDMCGNDGKIVDVEGTGL